MAIFTLNEALKRGGVKASDVKTVTTPTTKLPPESNPIISALSGKTSFPASMGGAESVAPNIAKTFGNVPSSAAKLVAPVNPLAIDSPVNIGANIAKGGAALYDIYKNRGVEQGAKDILGGFADTYLKIGESIYGGLDKAYNALLDDPKKAVADVTQSIAKIGIEDPMLIPTLLYGGGKLVGGKDAISRVASPVTRGADTSLANIADKTVAPVISKAGEVADATKTTLFGRPRPLSNIEDVIRQADESVKSDFTTSKTTGMKPSQVLSATEQASAQPSILQKWAGISPDIKNRIAGKQDKLKEYFDVAHARNNFDTVPTPLEYGAKNVDTAVTKMEGLLNDTGSQIGQFRNKVGTYKANVDNVSRIETSFNNQLSKLNLEVKGNAIKQKAGTIARVNSEAEIKVLNDLYKELQIIKQSPDLQRLIDFRNLFDSKINFAKSARDVSSSLDPFSRTMRKEIADIAAQIVGKSEAANLAKYAEFMDAYNNLRSFTDRKAGAEFLLKQVLSERGGTSRAIIQTIKDITGIDLMDDAVMSSIATDLIGNARQKGVFRQEITKAGLDTASLLTGNTSGAIGLMFNFLKKGLINEEKQFLKAAQ